MPVNAASTVAVPDVEPWFPISHGTPRLYAAELIAVVDGVPRTLAARNLGFRSVVADHSGDGFTVVVNAVRGASAGLLDLVADGGRLATITGDPPASERDIAITDLYVAADGGALEAAAAALVARGLSIAVAGTYALTEAATALDQATRGGGGGARVVLPARMNEPGGSREHGH